VAWRVPCVTDRCDIVRRALAGQRPGDGIEHFSGTEHLGDGRIGVELLALGQVTEGRGAVDRAFRRREFADEEPEQGALATAVGANDADAFVAQAEREVLEQSASVGEDETEVVGGEVGGFHAGGQACRRAGGQSVTVLCCRLALCCTFGQSQSTFLPLFCMDSLRGAMDSTTEFRRVVG
jgi:hypothetical protein